MGNLYIWFATATERREFVLRLLEIPRLAKRNGTKKAEKEHRKLVEDLAECLALLDSGKTKSPYFNLHKRYYNGVIPTYETKQFTRPWDPPIVFMKGFRQLYTQNSYAFRPGKWLVLQFRATKEAMERYNWVLGQIPKERLGRNVPLPPSYFARKKLEWAKEFLSRKHSLTPGELQKVYSELNGVQAEYPEVFNGDDAYLWEQLAFGFNSYGQIKQAEACLRIQAGLQPTKSDSFLNLGVFLTGYGLYQSAIAAYQEGLKRAPQCEFLNYNLASLASFLGRDALAQSALNQAMIANPERGLNFFAKGALCLEKEQYEMAIKYFRQAIDLTEGEEWQSLRIDCMINEGFANLKLGKYDRAIELLQRANSLDADRTKTHELLAECYKQQGEEWFWRWHLKRVQQLKK